MKRAFGCFGYMSCDFVDLCSENSISTSFSSLTHSDGKIPEKHKQCKSQKKLLRAITQNQNNRILTLLASGEHPDIPDPAGTTPLHYAVEKNCIIALGHFLHHGVNVNIQNSQGNTPLHIAAEKSGWGLVEILLMQGAQVNIQNGKGETPLHLAAANGNLRSVKTLIDAGGDLLAENLQGEQPLDYARVFAKDWGQCAQELRVRIAQNSISKQKNRSLHQRGSPRSSSSKLPTILE
eukprot:TRINITY_DN3873_c0_g1_i1.p4 TRINITY_DN3873_c0_g1~~TRINITY_DN3873_c0_g1_i1.p4  ORF type:complete len:236 (-),score=28.26 TRINITY_DN3873_c0_g1_i1:1109-1816(-)